MNGARRLRLWLALNQSPLTLALILLFVGIIATLLICMMLWALQSRGPAEPIPGVAKAFGMRERDEGSYRVMLVQTADGTVALRAPVRRDCRVGDRVVLRRTQTRVSAMYGLASCARGTPSNRPDPKRPPRVG